MLSEEQRRFADGVMHDMLADGWEPSADLQDAVFQAFMTGRGEWEGLVITVDWEHP